MLVPTRNQTIILCLLSIAALSGLSLVLVMAPGSSAQNVKESAAVFTTSVRQIPLPGNAIFLDQAAQKLYVSVPGTAGTGGNSIATVDPASGTIDNSVTVGSEPNKLAMASDGHTLYVSLDGSRSVRRFDTMSQTAGLQFPVGVNDSEGPLRLVDLAASPDDANTVAITRCSAATSACQKVAIYDNGVPRPAILGEGSALAFSNSSSTLYGINSSSQLETLSVTSTGITGIVKTAYDGPTKIVYSNGFIYGSRGKVFNALTGVMAGTFPTGTSSNLPFVLDAANHKIFFLRSSSGQLTISAFDIDTFVLIGSIAVPDPYTATAIERWGSNGLAVTNSDGPLFLIQSTLVNSDDPVPTVTPTPFTPAPTPTPVFARKIDQLNNDIFYNTADADLYISVPGTATNGTGNSIARIDPTTGALVSSAFIGSEPNRMARSDDERTIYVSLNGVNAIRRFDISSQTAGLQFANSVTANSVVDLAVVPGSANSVIVSTGNGGAAIYDNGVKRPNIPRNGNVAAWIGPVEFSASPNMFYGYDNTSTAFTLFNVSIDANGLNNVSSTRNLVYAFGNLDMKFAEGKIFTVSGRVADPVSKTLLGTYSGAGTGVMTFTIDTTSRRVFIASTSGISVYDMDTFVKLGVITLPALGGSPAGLVRWGENGLALRVTTPPTQYILLIQSPLVSTSVPTPTGYNLTTGAISTAENSGQIQVTINRSGDLSQSTTVKYFTADGTAIAGSDYTAASSTLTFAQGQTTRTFNVSMINDNVFETSESFSVNITDPSGATGQLLSPASASVTLQDDDQRPSISDLSTSVDEPSLGNTSVANVTVRLSNPSVETVSINYHTADGTAVAGSDYQATSGTLTFDPLQTVKTVPITVFGDNSIEGDEGFFLQISSPVNGTVSSPQAAITIIDHGHSAAQANFDFDGDGKSDISLFRPSIGTWFAINSSDGSFSINQWGLNGEKTVPADYDGDGKTDLAVWRPSNGVWFWINSSTGTVGGNQFGLNGDIPAPADYDGDGKADIMIYRPSAGQWWIYASSSNNVSVTFFGSAEDKPTIGDFDGDGIADIALFRPSNGTWYRINSSTGNAAINQFGLSGDKPVAADYDADGKTDIAIWRPSNGAWYWVNSANGTIGANAFGLSEDQPAPGDYDGDGKSDLAVYRPSQGAWYLLKTTQGFSVLQFGAAGDIAAPGSYAY
jgi:hypothetical protein